MRCDLARLTDSHDESWRECAGSKAPLLTPSVDERQYPYSGLAADIQSADTLGTINFMTADAEEIDFGVIDVDGDLADCLGGVGMEKHSPLTADFPNLLDRLHDSDFIVDEQNADAQDFLGRLVDGFLQQFQV